MRILIISRSSKPLNIGGLKRHAHIQQLLRRKKIDVNLLISNIDHRTNKKYAVKKEKNIDVIKLLTSGNSFFSRVLSILEFSLKLQFKKIEKYDYIIGSSPDLISAFSAYFLSLRNKCNFILEVRDIWPLSISELTNIRFGLVILKRIESFLYNKSKIIITTLPSLDEYFSDNGFESHIEKIFVLPQMTNAKPVDKNLNQEEYNGKLKIVYCGSLRLNNYLSKIFDYLDFANKKYGNFFNLTIIGEGSLRSKIQVTSNKYNFKTSFKTQIDDSQGVVNELSNYDLGVAYIKDSPLYKYGLSMNKSVDFLYSQTPLVIIGGKDKKTYFDFDEKFKLNYSLEEAARFFYNFHNFEKTTKENIIFSMREYIKIKKQSENLDQLISRLYKHR